MADLDEQLDGMCADGRITVHDTDEVRNFADFLESSGPPPGHPGFDRERFRAALLEHYPEELAKLAPVQTQETPAS